MLAERVQRFKQLKAPQATPRGILGPRIFICPLTELAASGLFPLPVIRPSTRFHGVFGHSSCLTLLLSGESRQSRAPPLPSRVHKTGYVPFPPFDHEPILVLANA